MFYAQIEKLCKEKGEKITPVLKKLNLSPGGIERWRKGAIPTGEVLLKFADYFGVSIDYLLGRDEDSVHSLNNINQNVVSSPNSTNLVNSTNSVYLSSDDKQLLELFGRLDLLQKNQTLNFIINKIEESKI